MWILINIQWKITFLTLSAKESFLVMIKWEGVVVVGDDGVFDAEGVVDAAGFADGGGVDDGLLIITTLCVSKIM